MIPYRFSKVPLWISISWAHSVLDSDGAISDFALRPAHIFNAKCTKVLEANHVGKNVGF